MKKIILVLVAALSLSVIVPAQTKSNDAISKQIKKLNIEKNFSVSYDGNTSRLMAVAENFADKETSRSGIQAMNFAMGFFYFGDTLKEAPDPILFSFWILSKRPRFADAHDVTLEYGTENFSFEEVRYAAKPREDMEYLNCKISRAELVRIIKEPGVKVRIGQNEFRFTPAQIKMLSNILSVSDPGIVD